MTPMLFIAKRAGTCLQFLISARADSLLATLLFFAARLDMARIEASIVVETADVSLRISLLIRSGVVLSTYRPP